MLSNRKQLDQRQVRNDSFKRKLYYKNKGKLYFCFFIHQFIIIFITFTLYKSSSIRKQFYNTPPFNSTFIYSNSKIQTYLSMNYRKLLIALFLIAILFTVAHQQQQPKQQQPKQQQTKQQEQPNQQEQPKQQQQQPKQEQKPKEQQKPKQQQPPAPLDYIPISLDKPYIIELTPEKTLSQKFRLNITEDNVKQFNQLKWFLFVDVQTPEELEWEKTKIQLFSVNKDGTAKPLRECDAEFGLDSCFLTNNNFNYSTQQIQAKVTCQQQCKFTISSQISTKYKLVPDEAIELNFENTAYSKLFSLDTNEYSTFRRLEILLKPRGFLSFNAPLRLFVNKGETIPTREKHDYAGIHLWDDGLGVFINFPDASGTFTILIQGPQKNILTLQTRIRFQSKPTQTTRHEPYFTFLQSQQTQLFSIPINKSQRTFIKLTTLTGSIQMSNVKDSTLKTIDIQFTELSRSYGQLQYKFEPSFFQINKQYNISDKLYIEIKANKDSTFVFQSYTSNEEMSFLMAEVNRYAEIDQGENDMYYFKLMELASQVNEKNSEARIQVMTTTYQYIDLGARFFICKSQNVTECQPTKQQLTKLIQNNQTIDTQKRKSIKPTSLDSSIPGVHYFELVIPYQQFIKPQPQLLQTFVIVVITNPAAKQQILYTLQYINLGQTYFLKEKQLKRDRLAIDQIKYYKFVNSDKDVKSVKVHSVEISGEILMVGYREDPRYNVVEGKEIYQYHGTVSYLEVKPGEELYLMVQGIDNAYFSLYLQLIRQSQVIKPDNKTSESGEGFNEIIIQEGVAYDFVIKPKERLIVQMRAKEMEFDLIVGSHLPLELCMTQDLTKAPFKPNCEIAQELTKNEKLGILMDRGLIGNMGVTNNNNRSVQFKVQMRPKFNKNDSSTPLCTNSPLGILNKWSVKQSTPTNPNILCYKFNINRRENLELVVELDNMEYDNATITWQLNDKQKEVMMNARHLIWKKELVKVCGQDEKLSNCELTVTVESNYSTQAHAVVQFLDKDLVLIDGMSHPSFTQAKSTQPKHFRYQLLNHVNTTIVVQNKVGYFHFLGKIVSRKQYLEAQSRASLYPTDKDHLFKSDNPFYFVYQTYILTQEQIKKGKCESDCVLLISVVPEVNDVTSEDFGRFVIEVSQEDRYLKPGQPIVGYIERGSLAFYEFYNPQKGTIYIQLNNQNQYCARLFIKKGNQTRATPSAYDKSQQNSNSLIFEDAQQGPYSIALQAKHMGCSYTIEGYSSIVQVGRVKRGVFSDKVLQANQTYHFLYEHKRDQSFKILTLNKGGQLMIKLKVLYQGQLTKLMSCQTPEQLQTLTTTLTYQQSNIDFLKVHHKKSKYFCANCTYLISVTATKYTETSIIIPTKDVEIPIVTDALIKDEVKEKEQTKFRIFTSNIFMYKLYVQYGRINVTIVESVTGKVMLSKIYEQTKEPIYEKFNTTDNNDSGKINPFNYDFVHYSLITIEGVANSSFYSFELSESQTKKDGTVKYGIPEYFFLQPSEIKCFTGVIDDPTEEFIVSFDDGSVDKVKKMEVTVKVDGKKVEYDATYGVSEMIMEIKELKVTEPVNYQICLRSNESLSLMFIQSAHIMMIPSDTSILLTHPTNITFGAKGTTILQIDQCGSNRSIISVSSSFNSLHSAQSEVSQVRRGNSLIQFYFWGPVYVHIQTLGTRIRWRNKDTYKQYGMGYDRFIPGTATAFKQDNSIIIQAQPLEQVTSYSKNVTFKLSEVSYRIILAANEKQLLSSLNCFQKDVIKYEFSTGTLATAARAVFPITQQMKAKFHQGKYFLAGVIASLNLEVNGLMENYRFIYPMVDIQREVLYGQEFKPVGEDDVVEPTPKEKFKDEGLLTMILVGLTAFILLAVVCYCVYQKWIWRWLRSRRQKLSEQGSSNFKYVEFASMDA